MHGRGFDYLTKDFLYFPGSSVCDVSPAHLSVCICRYFKLLNI